MDSNSLYIPLLCSWKIFWYLKYGHIIWKLLKLSSGKLSISCSFAHYFAILRNCCIWKIHFPSQSPMSLPVWATNAALGLTTRFPALQWEIHDSVTFKVSIIQKMLHLMALISLSAMNFKLFILDMYGEPLYKIMLACCHIYSLHF